MAGGAGGPAGGDGRPLIPPNAGSAAVLHQFREDPHRTGGVKERDEVSVRSSARLLVDQPNAAGHQSGQFGLNIFRAVCDVMETRAPTLEKAPDRGVGGEGLEELHGADERDPDSLTFERFRGGALSAGEEFEAGCAIFNRVNGDRDVVERVRRG